MIRINYISDELLVKMDETAVYFDTRYTYTLYEMRVKTESVWSGCSVNKRCIAAAADGTYLPLFLIFKATENE